MNPCYITTPSPGLVAEAGRGSLLKLPLHRNDGLEVTFLEHGHVKWVVEDQVMELEGGSIFYSFPWETHGSTEEYEPGHFWHFVVLRGDSRKSKRVPLSFRRLGLDPARSAEMMRILQRATKRHWSASALITITIKELVSAVQAREANSSNDEIIETLSKLLLVELTRIVSLDAGKSPLPFTPNIKDALSRIKAQPEKKWTLANMAAAGGVHRTYFTKAVRHETGDTPLSYLRRMRIDHARKMLQAGDRSITEIAFACGFESSQHFARIFRQFTGQSASDYRKGARRTY